MTKPLMRYNDVEGYFYRPARQARPMHLITAIAALLVIAAVIYGVCVIF